MVISSLAAYILTGYSLYPVAKRCSVKYPFLAWVPILQYYIIGSVIEEYVLLGYRIKHLEWVMCGLAFLQVACGFSGMLWYLGIGVLGFCAKILISLCMHKYFYLFEPSYAMIFAVICIFGRLPFAIVLFLMKDKSMQMSAGAYPYPFAKKL